MILPNLPPPKTSTAPWCLFGSGSRDLRREHYLFVASVLALYTSPYPGVFIHGDGDGRNGSVGFDKLAAHAAEKLGWTVYGFPADWDRLNKRAGPCRNRLCAEILLAHSYTQHSLGFVAVSTGGPGTEGAHKIVVDQSRLQNEPVNIEKFVITL